MSTFDAVLRDAATPDGARVDVAVRDGLVAAVTPAGSTLPDAATVHHLGGALLVPGLVEPHAHLDKAMSADAAENVTGDLDGAIVALVGAMERGAFSRHEVARRARLAVEQLVSNGVTLVRSHADVVDGVGGERVEVLAELRREYADVIDIEVVALVGSPLAGRDAAPNRRALAAALAAGADVVGGCPHLDADPAGCIRVVFDAAEEAGLPIDLHNDETLEPSMMMLPTIADEKERRGFALPVAASHCVSLAVQPLDEQRRIARRLAEAGVAVIPQPATNLYLQARGAAVVAPRAIAPIGVLLEQGVMVAAGGDNVQDPFNPVGRGDPLEVAALLVLAAHQLPGTALDLVGNNARAVLGRPMVSLTPGAPADFVALRCGSVRQAVAGDVGERRVFRAGRLVATRVSSVQLHRDGA